MTIRMNADITSFDPYSVYSLMSVESAWMERLFADDWTLDPAVYNYQTAFRPNQYETGQLAKSWEFTDPTTFVVHLRQGISWQNIPPANGREFTADDVVFHYYRMYDPATGGFTKFLMHATSTSLLSLISVTATDKYTVVFKWQISSRELIYESVMLAGTQENCIENPEAVKLWGNLNDWHHAIGTGPFILEDFVSSSSATMVKNPDYWGYDERYPQNKLPYIDTLRYIIIPDNATALAGLRTGKIDVIDGNSLQNAQSIQKTNPEILQIKVPLATGLSIDPRVDVAPFKDIRVRKAMQMAINLPEIAKSYYLGSADPYPLSRYCAYVKGWGFPYDQWPQDLKDEYAYNPTAAKKLLADAGYPNGFKTNIVVDTTYDMDLLQIVKSYFADVNINMEIRTLDSASWTGFVKISHKQDQLAATSAGGQVGNSREPMGTLNALMSTHGNNYTMVNDPAVDAFALKLVAATSVDEAQKVLSDAAEYIARQHLVISLLQPMTFSLVQPWLKGYGGQVNALSGSWGPTFLFFYPARFWIDQNMKRSMGH